MLRLHILRHGKAERDAPSGRDYDRRLRPRGERQAAFVGAALAEREKGRAGAIVASPAARALATATIVQKATGWALTTDDRLVVGSSTDEALEVVRAALGAKQTGALVIVGHNPTLEDLADRLEGGRGRSAGLRTGECASFDVQLGEGGAIEARPLGRVRLDEDED